MNMNPVYLIVSVLLLLVVWQAYVLVKLASIKKHDTILFQFCQLRRNLNRFIAKEWEQLTQEEYEQIALLQVLVNETIANFGEMKIIHFNLKKWGNIQVEAFENSETVEKLLNISAKPEINRLLLEYKYCVVLSIFAYTPGLRMKMTARITILFIKLFGDKVKEVSVDWYSKQWNWISDPSHKYNPYINYGAV